MGATGFPEFDREIARITEQLSLAMDIPGRVADVKTAQNRIAESGMGAEKAEPFVAALD
jgi:hypothetical protein